MKVNYMKLIIQDGAEIFVVGVDEGRYIYKDDIPT